MRLEKRSITRSFPTQEKKQAESARRQRLKNEKFMFSSFPNVQVHASFRQSPLHIRFFQREGIIPTLAYLVSKKNMVHAERYKTFQYTVSKNFVRV